MSDPPRATNFTLSMYHQWWYIIPVVKVDFANKRLERRFYNPSDAIREWGPSIGLRYVNRIELLVVADSLQALMKSRALRLHPLKGNMSGLWAMILQGRWRLIIEPVGDQSVIVREVSAHYGD